MDERERDKRTETTPKGLEVPVPKRKEFFANLKKLAQPKRQPESDEDSTTSGSEH